MANLKNTSNTKIYTPPARFLNIYKALTEYCKRENVNPLNVDLDALLKRIEDAAQKQENILISRADLIKEENKLKIDIRELYSTYRQAVAFLKAKAEEDFNLKNTLNSLVIRKRRKKRTVEEQSTDSTVTLSE